MGTSGVEEPGTWGPTWRGGHPDSLGVSICAPALDPGPSSRCAPGTAPAPEERRGGVGAELCCAIYSPVSAGGGVRHQAAPHPHAHTHKPKKKKEKKNSASNLDFPFLTHLPQPQQT